MNTHVQVFVKDSALGLGEYVSRSGIAVSCANSVFHLPRSLCPVLYGGCTFSFSPQQCAGVLVSLQAPRHQEFPGCHSGWPRALRCHPPGHTHQQQPVGVRPRASAHAGEAVVPQPGGTRVGAMAEDLKVSFWADENVLSLTEGTVL